jgi:hypothetical protein
VSVATVSAVPFALALVVGVGGFAALLPFLIADSRAPARVRPPRTRVAFPRIARSVGLAPELRVMRESSAVDAPVRDAPRRNAPAPATAPAPLRPRATRFRLVVTIGALVVWSVWSVRKPRQIGRHD